MNNFYDMTHQNMAELQLSNFKWLIENYCPNVGPLRSTFQTFENGELAGMPAYDASNPDEWAQDYLQKFLARIHCTDLAVTLVLRDKNLPKRDSDKELISPSYQTYDTRYYIDQYGRPVIYAEPSKLGCSGYLARRLTIAVSNQIQLSAQTQRSLSEEDRKQLSLLTAVFLGLSLTLTPNSRAESTHGENETALENDGFHPDEPQILFATVIYWRLKGLKYESAMPLYGEQYSETARAILKQACTHLENYTQEIEALRQNIIALCLHNDEKSAVA